VAGDDYGVSKLQVVYYDQNKPLLLQRANLGIKASFDQFVFLPAALNVKEGGIYYYYFEFLTMMRFNYKSCQYLSRM
jgi:hypothetical protein